SGFHALVSSGTTPKMISKEGDARMIGYGAMLLEGLVGIVALVAACALEPGDYFAINVAPAKFAALHMAPVHLDVLSKAVGEELAGRPGGAVSLAVGFADIFGSLPGLKHLTAYWYHYAIMFEALFILTTIDTGTRVGRFLVQEFLGKFSAPLGKTDWLPGTLLSTGLVVVAWAGLIHSGSISTIWPMFGIANQLLAGVALSVATTALINAGKARYAWTTAVPFAFVTVTTLCAGALSIRDNFFPLTRDPQTATLGWVNSSMTALIMACAVVILADAGRRCVLVLRGGAPPASADGGRDDAPALGCC
ncbi:MAG TPA: carbon starvation CstA 5TM domain-containing protein, partial [Elusimicrobiota bacterium]|nr:carbon starvation CstA 5TM domain-containing protein [Elusimicrobiota bacterium]